MISPRTSIPLSAADAGTSSPASISIPKQIGDWHHIGAVWDETNRAKDRQDEALDAMRVSGGMTLDQFLETAR
jgi:hypothetical protein